MSRLTSLTGHMSFRSCQGKMERSELVSRAEGIPKKSCRCHLLTVPSTWWWFLHRVNWEGKSCHGERFSELYDQNQGIISAQKCPGCPCRSQRTAGTCCWRDGWADVQNPDVQYQAELLSEGWNDSENINMGFAPQSFQNMKKHNQRGKTSVFNGLGRNCGDLAKEKIWRMKPAVQVGIRKPKRERGGKKVKKKECVWNIFCMKQLEGESIFHKLIQLF